MMIEAVLFDKDGTLFDFQATWAPWLGQVIEELAAGDGARAGALARAWGYDAAAGRIAPGSVVVAGAVRELAERVAGLLEGHDTDSLLAHLLETSARVTAREVLPLAGFLQGLRRGGLRLGLATNDAEAVARAQLGPLARRFDFIAGYDSGHGAKPAAGMCVAFAAAVGIAPGRIVMVGDSRHDLAAGRAAGMRTVAVLSGPAGAEELAPLADAVLPDIGHLPGWIEEENHGPD